MQRWIHAPIPQARPRCALPPVTRQFVLFVLNGGIVGVFCWGLQQLLYAVANNTSQWAYWGTSLLASAVAIVVNFRMQRRFIFVARDGNFWLFASIASTMSIAVAGSAVLARNWLEAYLSAPAAERWGFMVGALAVAPVSFAAKKLIVFRRIRK